MSDDKCSRCGSSIRNERWCRRWKESSSRKPHILMATCEECTDPWHDAPSDRPTGAREWLRSKEVFDQMWRNADPTSKMSSEDQLVWKLEAYAEAHAASLRGENERLEEALTRVAIRNGERAEKLAVAERELAELRDKLVATEREVAKLLRELLAVKGERISK